MGLEIERSYLLRALPALPAGAEATRIEQGYLPDPPPDRVPPARGAAGDVVEGRIRRKVGPDGSVACTHTIKVGEGLTRRETERSISVEEFERRWPLTEGRRLVKTRHAVAEDGFVWEIDEFDDLDLVLAEVELPEADAHAPLPEWLAAHVVREVTDEPEFRNYRLALRLAEERAAR